MTNFLFVLWHLITTFEFSDFGKLNWLGENKFESMTNSLSQEKSHMHVCM